MRVRDDFTGSISLVDDVYSVLDSQKKDSKRIGNMLKTTPKCSHLIVGDLHGDLDGLEILFSKVNVKGYLEDTSNKVIFLGDYIDRGPRQLETLEYVLSLFLSNPDQVILLRGNHEGPKDLPCLPNDFKRMTLRRFGENASRYLDKIQTLFDNLLTGVIIEERALLLHGGIPTHGKRLEDIAYAHQLHPVKSHLKEILWNDPMSEKGIKKSPRGEGYLFGPDITEGFLDKLKVRTLIRGHQADPKGYKVDHDRILTLFSSKSRSYSNTQRTALLAGKNHSYEIRDLLCDLVFF